MNIKKCVYCCSKPAVFRGDGTFKDTKTNEIIRGTKDNFCSDECENGYTSEMDEVYPADAERYVEV